MAVDFIQDFRPHGDVGVFRDFFLVRNSRRSREKQHFMGVADELFQVVEKVRCGFFVVQNEEVARSTLFGGALLCLFRMQDGRGNQGAGRAYDALQLRF